MLKKITVLGAAVCTACSLTAAEAPAAAAKSAPAVAKNAAPVKAKKAKAKRKPYIIPADGGLKIATTAKARNNPNAKKKGAWHKRYEQKVKQIADYNKKIDMLWIGDSITHFWDNRGAKEQAKYFSKYKVVNLGYSGDRTEHTLWIINQSGYLKELDAKMAVVMIGTNNIGHKRCTPAAAAAGVAKVVESLRAQLPNTKILLFGVFPRDANSNNVMRKQVAEINKIICKLGDDKNVFYCDITDKFLTAKGTLPRKLMPDLLHPNAAGYDIWAQAIVPYLEKFVGKK